MAEDNRASRAFAAKSSEDSGEAGSERRFRALFEKAGVGMAEIAEDWSILAANHAYCEIAGRDIDAVLGCSCLAFTDEEDLEKSREVLRSISGDGPDAASFEKRYIRPDGSTVWIRSNIARIEQPDGGNRFLKIVEDINDAKRAELALNEAQRKLREEGHNLETMNRIGSALAGELDLE